LVCGGAVLVVLGVVGAAAVVADLVSDDAVAVEFWEGRVPVLGCVAVGVLLCVAVGVLLLLAVVLSVGLEAV
jgi:hypothetical protein